MNFLVFKKVIIDLSKQRVVFDSCKNVSVSCHTTARDNVNVCQSVRVNKIHVISSNSTRQITVFVNDKSSLSKRDFIFKSELKNIYSHFVNFNVIFINVRNDKFKSTTVFKNQRLKRIVEYNLKENYFIKTNNYFLTVKIHDQTIENFIRILNLTSEISRLLTSFLIETKLINNITIYEDQETMSHLHDTIKRYLRI